MKPKAVRKKRVIRKPGRAPLECPLCGSRDVKKGEREMCSGSTIPYYACGHCGYKFTPAGRLPETCPNSGTFGKKRIAMPAGKRISKTGKLYYEYRTNRSDADLKECCGRERV